MRVLFMGTPDFAVTALKKLCDAKYDIVGVFTQPDKPQGRKMVLTPPPVKQFARERGLSVYQPQSVRKPEVISIIRELAPDIIIVVAYGKILPPEILSIPRYGCVNAHASLLPRHRGASPIQWAIYSGDTETGVTTMLMDEGMDTGDMLLTERTAIMPDDTFETLHDRLAVIGAGLLTETVRGLESGSLKPVKQPDSGVTYAPIIKKEMGLVDFKRTAHETDCQIRAFTPWPSAYFMLDGQRVKILSAHTGEKTKSAPGTVTASKDNITVACADGTSLVITKVRPEGRGAMTAKALLNGHQVEVGKLL